MCVYRPLHITQELSLAKKYAFRSCSSPTLIPGFVTGGFIRECRGLCHQCFPSRQRTIIFKDANPHLLPPQPVPVVVGHYVDRCIIAEHHSLVSPIMMLMLRPVVSRDTPINQPQTLINCPLREGGFPPTKINSLTHLHLQKSTVSGLIYYSAFLEGGNNDLANAFLLQSMAHVR